jgi:GT2 family glycosyltransferase
VTALSVVIPTYNRPDALADTLDSLAAQEFDGEVEVEVAQAPVVLFLGDDMAPAQRDLLARHVDLHARRPEATYGVLGRATWRPDRPVTPFMRWLENGGPQFAFHELDAGPVPASRYLYTAHASFKRSLLAANPFDERFPFAAVEDTELGLRLERGGLELDYHPELLVHHDHPTSVEQAVARMRKVGASARRLEDIQPGSGVLPAPAPHWRLYPLLRPLASRSGIDRPRVWSLLLWSSYADGYRRASEILPR